MRKSGYSLHLVAVLTAGLGFANPALADASATDDLDEQKARAIHEDVLTIDSHIDIPDNYATRDLDPGRNTPLQVDLPKMLTGGLDAGFFIVFVGQGPLTDAGFAEAYDKAIAKFDAIDRQTALYSHIIDLATSPADVRALADRGRLVAMIGVENGYSLGANIEHIQEFYDRGARYMGITHMGNNQLGDSSGGAGGKPDPLHGGLSELGRQAVAEMNRLGVMVDVSHASKKTTLEAIKQSKAPVIASHSAIRKFRDLDRNISRKEMKAIAKSGGVLQVVAFDAYMHEIEEEKAAAMAEIRQDMGLTSREAFRAAGPEGWAELRQRVIALDDTWPRADVSDLVDQIDYAVKVMGIDHVGIASDFGGGGGIMGWDDATQTLNITRELVRRGYGQRDIAKIWGGNLLRVWHNVERVAASLQANAEN